MTTQSTSNGSKNKYLFTPVIYAYNLSVLPSVGLVSKLAQMRMRATMYDWKNYFRYPF